MSADFIDEYIKFTAPTEPHAVYHRWSIISAIGALLGRSYYFPFGHSKIFPNLYTMFVGLSGSRKSSAIKLCKKFITESGYDCIGATKTSKEKFLLDLEGTSTDDLDTTTIYAEGIQTSNKYRSSIVAQNIFGDSNILKEPREVFIIADEFNEFAGAGNIDFYRTLGDLWDWDDEARDYTSRLKNSKSVSIYQPTVSILGGITPEDLARTFPPDTGQIGFFSRLLFIHGVRSDRYYHLPPSPDSNGVTAVIERLREIRASKLGCAAVDQSADKLLERLYKTWQAFDDVRFRPYFERRYTQLIKLCLVISAGRSSGVITEEIVFTANTYLAAAEINMSQALGEFGKSRNSDIAQKIMTVINKARKPVSYKELFKEVQIDIEKPSQLMEIMQNLEAARKIQKVGTGINSGYLPMKEIKRVLEFVNFDILTLEERKLIS